MTLKGGRPGLCAEAQAQSETPSGRNALATRKGQQEGRTSDEGCSINPKDAARERKNLTEPGKERWVEKRHRENVEKYAKRAMEQLERLLSKQADGLVVLTQAEDVHDAFTTACMQAEMRFTWEATVRRVVTHAANSALAFAKAENLGSAVETLEAAEKFHRLHKGPAAVGRLLMSTKHKVDKQREIVLAALDARERVAALRIRVDEILPPLYDQSAAAVAAACQLAQADLEDRRPRREADSRTKDQQGGNDSNALATGENMNGAVSIDANCHQGTVINASEDGVSSEERATAASMPVNFKTDRTDAEDVVESKSELRRVGGGGSVAAGSEPGSHPGTSLVKAIDHLCDDVLQVRKVCRAHDKGSVEDVEVLLRALLRRAASWAEGHLTFAKTCVQRYYAFAQAALECDASVAVMDCVLRNVEKTDVLLEASVSERFENLYRRASLFVDDILEPAKSRSEELTQEGVALLQRVKGQLPSLHLDCDDDGEDHNVGISVKRMREVCSLLQEAEDRLYNAHDGKRVQRVHRARADVVAVAIRRAKWCYEQAKIASRAANYSTVAAFCTKSCEYLRIGGQLGSELGSDATLLHQQATEQRELHAQWAKKSLAEATHLLSDCLKQGKHIKMHLEQCERHALSAHLWDEFKPQVARLWDLARAEADSACQQLVDSVRHAAVVEESVEAAARLFESADSAFDLASPDVAQSTKAECETVISLTSLMYDNPERFADVARCNELLDTARELTARLPTFSLDELRHDLAERVVWSAASIPEGGSGSSQGGTFDQAALVVCDIAKKIALATQIAIRRRSHLLLSHCRDIFAKLVALSACFLADAGAAAANAPVWPEQANVLLGSSMAYAGFLRDCLRRGQGLSGSVCPAPLVSDSETCAAGNSGEAREETSSPDSADAIPTGKAASSKDSEAGAGDSLAVLHTSPLWTDVEASTGLRCVNAAWSAVEQAVEALRRVKGRLDQFRENQAAQSRTASARLLDAVRLLGIPARDLTKDSNGLGPETPVVAAGDSCDDIAKSFDRSRGSDRQTRQSLGVTVWGEEDDRTGGTVNDSSVEGDQSLRSEYAHPAFPIHDSKAREKEAPGSVLSASSSSTSLCEMLPSATSSAADAMPTPTLAIDSAAPSVARPGRASRASTGSEGSHLSLMATLQDATRMTTEAEVLFSEAGSQADPQWRTSVAYVRSHVTSVADSRARVLVSKARNALRNDRFAQAVRFGEDAAALLVAAGVTQDRMEFVPVEELLSEIRKTREASLRHSDDDLARVEAALKQHHAFCVAEATCFGHGHAMRASQRDTSQTSAATLNWMVLFGQLTEIHETLKEVLANYKKAKRTARLLMTPTKSAALLAEIGPSPPPSPAVSAGPPASSSACHPSSPQAAETTSESLVPSSCTTASSNVNETASPMPSPSLPSPATPDRLRTSYVEDSEKRSRLRRVNDAAWVLAEVSAERGEFTWRLARCMFKERRYDEAQTVVLGARSLYELSRAADETAGSTGSSPVLSTRLAALRAPGEGHGPEGLSRPLEPVIATFSPRLQRVEKVAAALRKLTSLCERVKSADGRRAVADAEALITHTREALSSCDSPAALRRVIDDLRTAGDVAMLVMAPTDGKRLQAYLDELEVSVGAFALREVSRHRDLAHYHGHRGEFTPAKVALETARAWLSAASELNIRATVIKQAEIKLQELSEQFAMDEPVPASLSGVAEDLIVQAERGVLRIAGSDVPRRLREMCTAVREGWRDGQLAVTDSYQRAEATSLAMEAAKYGESLAQADWMIAVVARAYGEGRSDTGLCLVDDIWRILVAVTMRTLVAAIGATLDLLRALCPHAARQTLRLVNTCAGLLRRRVIAPVELGRRTLFEHSAALRTDSTLDTSAEPVAQAAVVQTLTDTHIGEDVPVSLSRAAEAPRSHRASSDVRKPSRLGGQPAAPPARITDSPSATSVRSRDSQRSSPSVSRSGQGQQEGFEKGHVLYRSRSDGGSNDDHLSPTPLEHPAVSATRHLLRLTFRLGNALTEAEFGGAYPFSSGVVRTLTLSGPCTDARGPRSGFGGACRVRGVCSPALRLPTEAPPVRGFILVPRQGRSSPRKGGCIHSLPKPYLSTAGVVNVEGFVCSELAFVGCGHADTLTRGDLRAPAVRLSKLRDVLAACAPGLRTYIAARVARALVRVVQARELLGCVPLPSTAQDVIVTLIEGGSDVACLVDVDNLKRSIFEDANICTPLSKCHSPSATILWVASIFMSLAGHVGESHRSQSSPPDPAGWSEAVASFVQGIQHNPFPSTPSAGVETDSGSGKEGRGTILSSTGSQQTGAKAETPLSSPHEKREVGGELKNRHSLGRTESRQSVLGLEGVTAEELEQAADFGKAAVPEPLIRVLYYAKTLASQSVPDYCWLDAMFAMLECRSLVSRRAEVPCTKSGHERVVPESCHIHRLQSLVCQLDPASASADLTPVVLPSEKLPSMPSTATVFTDLDSRTDGSLPTAVFCFPDPSQEPTALLATLKAYSVTWEFPSKLAVLRYGHTNARASHVRNKAAETTIAAANSGSGVAGRGHGRGSGKNRLSGDTTRRAGSGVALKRKSSPNTKTAKPESPSGAGPPCQSGPGVSVYRPERVRAVNIIVHVSHEDRAAARALKVLQECADDTTHTLQVRQVGPWHEQPPPLIDASDEEAIFTVCSRNGFWVDTIAPRVVRTVSSWTSRPRRMSVPYRLAGTSQSQRSEATARHSDAAVDDPQGAVPPAGAPVSSMGDEGPSNLLSGGGGTVMTVDTSRKPGLVKKKSFWARWKPKRKDSSNPDKKSLRTKSAYTASGHDTASIRPRGRLRSLSATNVPSKNNTPMEPLNLPLKHRPQGTSNAATSTMADVTTVDPSAASPSASPSRQPKSTLKKKSSVWRKFKI